MVGKSGAFQPQSPQPSKSSVTGQKEAVEVDARFLDLLGLRKMSTVLMEYARPLLKHVDLNNEELFKEALRIAVIWWNAGMLTEVSQERAIHQLKGRWQNRDPAFLKRTLAVREPMLERRAGKYRADPRLVTKWGIEEREGGKKKLRVESKMDRPKPW